MIIPNQCLFLGLQTNHRPIWWSAKDCNPLLAEIEQAIHAPFAAPEQPLGFSQEWAERPTYGRIRENTEERQGCSNLLIWISCHDLTTNSKVALFRVCELITLYKNDPDQWIIATGRGIGLVYLLLYRFLCFVYVNFWEPWKTGGFSWLLATSDLKLLRDHNESLPSAFRTRRDILRDIPRQGFRSTPRQKTECPNPPRPRSRR